MEFPGARVDHPKPYSAAEEYMKTHLPNPHTYKDAAIYSPLSVFRRPTRLSQTSVLYSSPGLMTLPPFLFGSLSPYRPGTKNFLEPLCTLGPLHQLISYLISLRADIAGAVRISLLTVLALVPRVLLC